MSLKPTQLDPYFREMIWGTTDLKPWFPRQENKVGEVWFPPPATFPILAKFIFPADRLSIQVHPSDFHAARLEGRPGKVEMWHILRAQPGASIALGPREPITRERLREAALTGEIKTLIRWIPVRAGETYFVYPGTVHTISPGVVLCEIQQNSDLTYRLYDWGRSRELHLEKAVQVANLSPHPGASIPVILSEGRSLLASCPYFATERWDLTASTPYQPDLARDHLLVVLEGSGSLGSQPFAAGEAWLVPADTAPFVLQVSSPACLLRTYVPKEADSPQPTADSSSVWASTCRL